jgi:hypothetical protein
MGGLGSGPSWPDRLNAKPLVEDAVALDVAVLTRAGVLRLGQHVISRCALAYPALGTRFELQIEADLTSASAGDGQLIVTFRAGGEERTQVLQVVTTQQNLGGERVWFICPQTGKRTRVLYLPLGADQFASRQAHGLAYRSTREKEHLRQITAVQKIRSRLKGDLSIYAPLPQRPSRMHRRTYERLASTLERRQMPLADLPVRNLDEELDRLIQAGLLRPARGRSR